VVGEPIGAPGVLVAAFVNVNTGHEQMVKAVSALPALPPPTDLAVRVAVQIAEGVTEPEWLEAAKQGEFAQEEARHSQIASIAELQESRFARRSVWVERVKARQFRLKYSQPRKVG